MAYKEISVSSSDGLQLFVRDYVSEGSETAVLCLHGFMRTGRDYDDIATHLSAKRRVIVPDIRGRGDSGYAASLEGYMLDSLIDDAWRILSELNVDKVVVLGATLGALMGMVMANSVPDKVVGVILIDEGAEASMDGVMRMFAHGHAEQMIYETAVATIREQNEAFFPDKTDDYFAKMMLNAHRQDNEGFYVRDLDQVCRGATLPLLEAYGKPDYWDEFLALGATPALALRGEHSDYVTAEIYEKMAAAKDNFSAVTIEGVGHPPQLDEPLSIKAIDDFLNKL